MIENVTVVDKNGNSIIAEGISYINVPSFGKKYLFYTLNEIVENTLTKIYIAPVGESVGTAQPISDNEWHFIKDTMGKISHGESVTDIQYMPMSGATFYTGDPKKLAVKAEAKQAFRDRQTTSTLAVNQGGATNVSAMPQEQATPSFFNNEAIAPAPEQPQGAEQSETSIFENPMQPIEYAQPQPEITPQPSTIEPVAPVVSPELVDTTVNIQNPVDAMGVNGQQDVSTAVPQVSSQVAVAPQTDALASEENLNDTNEFISKDKITKIINSVLEDLEKATENIKLLNEYLKNDNKIDSNNVVPEVGISENVPQVPEIAVTEPVIQENPEYINMQEPPVITAAQQVVPGVINTAQMAVADNASSQTMPVEPIINQEPNAYGYESPVIMPDVEQSVDIQAEPSVPPVVDASAGIIQQQPTASVPEYTASGNVAAVQFGDSAVNPTNAEVPPAEQVVVMPDGYHEAKSINSIDGMGPASLNAEGTPTLGLRDAA